MATVILNVAIAAYRVGEGRLAESQFKRIVQLKRQPAVPGHDAGFADLLSLGLVTGHHSVMAQPGVGADFCGSSSAQPKQSVRPATFQRVMGGTFLLVSSVD
jgi:hypothetical protein